MKKIKITVNLTPWGVFVRSSLICGLLGAILLGLGHKKIEPLPLNHQEPLFNSRSSFDYMSRLSKGFPNRVTWGKQRVAAGAWIKSELTKMGYTPKSLEFSEVIAGQQYTNLENIYVEKKGTTHPNEIIVAMAHYDITDTTVEGAMDDGSGVGIVLELARIFAQIPTDRTLLFLLTDSEEFGAFWGARAFAQSYDRVDQIIAALNFDFIAPEEQTGILTLCDGLKTGFTPLWLREIAIDSVRSFRSVEALDLHGFMELIERAIQIPPADHGPFLAAEIPTFTWVGQTKNFPYVMAHYHHTPYDRVEALKPESFEHFGKAAERVIRTIDSLPRIPQDHKNSSYWKISSRYYLPGVTVTLLHILAFIPFMAYSVFKSRRLLKKHSRSIILSVLQDEAKTFGILLASLLLGYAVMLFLPTLRVITQYETFPATQKSLLLYTPDFLAIILVLASVFGTYWIFRHTFTESHNSEEYLEVRHTLHAALLGIIIVLAFLKNSYLALLLLLPPAYFWTALKARRKTEDRILNGLLLIGGAITFVAMAIILGTVFHVGVLYWYLFLAAAYGLISAYTVVLFFTALTVMIRLFRSFVL